MVCIGLSLEEYNALTPGQFAVFARIYREKQEREDFRAGVTSSALYRIKEDWRGKKARKNLPTDDPLYFFGYAPRRTINENKGLDTKSPAFRALPKEERRRLIRNELGFK